jgi:osmotically-inducible protein OsmY
MKSMIFGLVCGLAILTGPISAHGGTSQDTPRQERDHKLTERIETRVQQDPALKTRDIYVSVDGGVVTLTGTVATSVQRARAARLARVTGISRVDNQIIVERSTRSATGTKGTLDNAKDAAKAGEKTLDGVTKVSGESTDTAIISRVKTRFVGEELLKGSEIKIDCEQHVVILRGFVASRAAKERAVEVANSVDDVQRVVDELTIGPKE